MGSQKSPSGVTVGEHPRLRILAVAPADYGLLFEFVVGPTGMVEHKGIRYAMPPEAIGFPATPHLFYVSGLAVSAPDPDRGVVRPSKSQTSDVH